VVAGGNGSAIVVGRAALAAIHHSNFNAARNLSSRNRNFVLNVSTFESVDIFFNVDCQ
jgi:hypothetical protein